MGGRTSLGSTTSAFNGTFSHAFTMPAGTAGPMMILVTGATSGTHVLVPLHRQ